MKTKLIYTFFMRSWWVIAFALLCGILYEQGLKKRHDDYIRLSEHLQKLQQEKAEVLAQQQDLQMSINSQSDPAWIELTLMKGLGLVPEGQQKVFFTPLIQ